jgi:hypothetical protein
MNLGHGLRRRQRPCPGVPKVFWFFFSKKNFFALLDFHPFLTEAV